MTSLGVAMRRILVRFVPMLALVAGLMLAVGPHATVANASSVHGGMQPAFNIWCC
ncbi:MAG: hypothetical protein ACRDXC_09600 [Acidimicrobiales bacterium]